MNASNKPCVMLLILIVMLIVMQIYKKMVYIRLILTYGNFSCITQNCKNCSIDIVKMKILEENDGIEKWKEKIT